jgi:hypothetical protein
LFLSLEIRSMTVKIFQVADATRMTVGVGSGRGWSKDYKDTETATTEAVELGGMTPTEKTLLDKSQRMPTYPKGFKNDRADIDIEELEKRGFERGFIDN